MNIIGAVLLAARLGFAAVNFETGRTSMNNQDERFQMGSAYKIPIAISVLRRIDRGELKLDQKIEPKDFALGFSPIRDKARRRAITSSA